MRLPTLASCWPLITLRRSVRVRRLSLSVDPLCTPIKPEGLALQTCDSRVVAIWQVTVECR